MVGDLARVILFVANVEKAKSFYKDVLGLRIVNDEGGFVEFEAGPCRVALHKTSKPNPGRTKLVFRVRDVEQTRALLLKKGVRMGALRSGNGFVACDGRDPDANPFQISTRV